MNGLNVKISAYSAMRSTAASSLYFWDTACYSKINSAGNLSG